MKQPEYYEAYAIMMRKGNEQAAFGFNSDEILVFNDKEKAESALKSLQTPSIFQRIFNSKTEYENASVEVVLIPKLI